MPVQSVHHDLGQLLDQWVWQVYVTHLPHLNAEECYFLKSTRKLEHR